MAVAGMVVPAADMAEAVVGTVVVVVEALVGSNVM